MIRLPPWSLLAVIALATVLATPTAVAQSPPTPRVDDAVAAYNTGQFERCVDLLSGAAPSFGSHFLRALCNLELGRFVTARRYILLSASYARTDSQIENQRALEATYEDRVPYSVRLGVSIRPSDNVDRITSSDTITIGDLEFDVSDNREDGYNLILEPGLTVRLLRVQSATRSLLISANGDYRYETLSDGFRDDWDLGLRAALGLETGVVRAGLGRTTQRYREVVTEQAWYSQASFATSFGLLSIQVDGRAERIIWPELDNTGWSQEAGVAALYGRRFRLGPVLRLGAVNTDAVTQERDWWAAGLIAEYDFGGPFGLRGGVAAQFIETDYRQRQPFFGETRKDKETAVEASLIPDRLQVFGFAPRLSVRHEDRRSSIAFYSYDRIEFGFGVARAF
ncbi:MAG: surface lipoprotein assembly modifier [Pseudomonadota bacterium]